jgi:hypothetical protein
MADEKKTTTKKKTARKVDLPKGKALKKTMDSAQKHIELQRVTHEWKKCRRVRERSELLRELCEIKRDILKLEGE